MGHQALCCGLIVVGADHQQRIGSHFFRCPAQGQGVLGVVGACSGNDGAIVACELFCCLKNGELFFIGKGRRLSGGSAEYNGMNSRSHLPVQQLSKHGIIHFSIGKRGNQSRTGSGENSFFHKLIPPCQYMPGNGILSVAKISGLGYTRTSIKDSMQKTE